MSFALAVVIRSYGLGFGLETQVLGIGFDLTVGVMSAAVRLTLDRSTPAHRWKQ